MENQITLANPLENWSCLADPAVKLRQLSKEETEALVMLHIAKEEQAAKMFPELVGQSLVLNIIQKRLERTGWQDSIDKRLLIFLASFCETPGQAVMWAFTVSQLANLEVDRRYTIDRFCMGPFAMGIPTAESMNEMWDFQKGYSHGIKQDNLLDNINIWPINV